ncbi:MULTISPECIES: PACE efflux transporter [Auritidibacter]|uniref:PACE efflux transporter n=1 Tax=Auritidibacter ignavus TaxID=678932 RepID=A0AAJ6AP09_9MICC|nr:MULTISPECIES: PACE efflux transporter [Auritidibacter]NIH71548.1 putative membrane protein [Auritidibacter ignavus]WGH81648.1 PACE efflux transporter [Auritidibacter ignavus]WGH83912.1 PACE efflux transporter [Auritidibacter ignavus]WGH90861.1 PACE efflux transporter [Auritidibacter ignavus]WGH93234.1 PACE efflux transporter [Auritidibacter ignavus]
MTTPTDRKDTTASQRSDIPRVPVGPGGKPAWVNRRVFASPLLRRICYAVVFEGLAVGFTTLILFLLGHASSSSFLVGVVSSTVALTWNLVFNWIFENLERLNGITHRPWWVRALHTVLFETGLLSILIPAVAVILNVSIWEALALEAVLLVFFLIYNPVYAYFFDRVFGLPEPAENYR